MSNILEKFKSALTKFNVDVKLDKCLLAVSGGADSVALSFAAKQTGLHCGIAHCNFHLRGKESDGDQKFVENLAQELNFVFHSIDFDTNAYAKEHGLSIQMAARELRYSWFNNLLDSKNYTYVFVAHHRDDQVETMLINLVRGTGVKGIAGMPVKNNRILRPLIDCSRLDIEEFLKRNNQPYRNDSTNAQTKYLRNGIRHNIIPAFEQIESDFRSRMLENADRFRESVDLLEELVELQAKSISENLTNGDIRINVKPKFVSPAFLFEMLRKFGFNRSQIDDLYSSNVSGKSVTTVDYKLINDRGFWILSKNFQSAENEFFIDNSKFKINKPIVLEGEVKHFQDVSISRKSTQVELDMELLQFPLVLRRWKKGDYFQPLGMKGRQKLSDFFINRKLSIRDKETVWLLCSGNDIVWVVGLQISDKFKVTQTSKQLLCLKLS